jgi:hypothetical protein
MRREQPGSAFSERAFRAALISRVPLDQKRGAPALWARNATRNYTIARLGDNRINSGPTRCGKPPQAPTAVSGKYCQDGTGAFR